MILQDTPTEYYYDDGCYIKREDLACLPPGPPFAKVRGLYKGLQEIKSRNIKTVGYFETSISMATWGIGYFCKLLNIHPVVFYYEYKELAHNRAKQHEIWEKYNIETHKLEKPNMQKIQEAVSSKLFAEIYPEGEFLPAGLKFDQTVDEVAKQVQIIPDEALGGTLIICTGSGMMAAGVLRGIIDRGISQTILGITIHPKNTENMKRFILKKSNVGEFDFVATKSKLQIINSGYEYTQKEECNVPFPCCPYYDRKAYKYMLDNMKSFKKPVLFWNIGAPYNF